MRGALLAFIILTAAAAVFAKDPPPPLDPQYALHAGGYDRTYLLHTPQVHDKPLPVVIVLHGAGGSASGASRVYGWREEADLKGFYSVFPQGLPVHPNLPADFLTNPNIWNEGSGRMSPRRSAIDDIAFLNAVLDDVAKRVQVDPQRIFVTGFSDGASMTFRAGAEMSSRIAAIAPVSGHCWQNPVNLSRPVPMIFIVGNKDPLNPFAGGPGVNPWGTKPMAKPPYQDSVDCWAKAIAAKSSDDQTTGDLTTHSYTGRDGCPMLFLVVNGLGHEWPGHRRTLPETITGPTVMDFDATARIWNFFDAPFHPATHPSPVGN